MRRRLLVQAGIILVWWAATGTAAMAQVSPEPSDEPFEDTCVQVLRGSPTGSAHKVTDPPHGSGVEGGEVVTVTITWTVEDFSGASVHKVLDCVTVDGGLVPELSIQVRRVANDGRFEHRFAIPEGLPGGTEICDRGFVSGRGADASFTRHKTNDVCFEVGPPERPVVAESPPPRGTPSPPPVARPAPPSPQPPPPALLLEPVVSAAPVLPPADVVVQPATAPPPSTPPAPADLPRTGTGIRALGAVAGLHLFLGGLAVMGGTRPRIRTG